MPPDSTGSSVRQRFEMALRAGGVGTWRWDIGSGVIDWDASMEELYGFAPGSFDGSYSSYATRLHPQDRPNMEAALAEALAARSPEYTVEHRILLPDGRVRWFASTAQLKLDDSGEPAELIGVAVDVTARVQAEQERTAAREAETLARSEAVAAYRRLELLAQASDLLDAPLDLDLTLQHVADLAIRELADWCVVDVRDGVRVHRAAIAHREPTMIQVAREMQDRFPSDPDNPVLRQLMRTLKPLYVRDFDDTMLRAAARGPEHERLLRSLDLSSYLVVPLVAGGKGLGTMLLVSTHGRRLEPDEVDLALELGRRAGAAIDKARLFGELLQTTNALQTSLLPPSLPHLPDVSLSAHYRAGTDGIDIGGDYYDVFRTSTDRWWVLLGDVCGMGPEAAALAASVRYTVRAIAPDTDDPADVVRRLNDVLLAGDWGERFTTLALATFVAAPPPSALPNQRHSGDRKRSEPLSLRLVTAGHPPALVRRADGTVTELSSPGTLVGLLPDLDLTTVAVVLHAGDTLVLYTDGATEARDATGAELGQDTLVRLVSELSEGPDPAGRLDQALFDCATGGLNDDLAILTLTR